MITLFDLVIKNGTIYDGSTNQAYKADIGIIKDKIVEVGDLKTYKSRDEIDASGLCIMPGFIDTHVHSDMALLYDRQHANGLYQGITTEILGQDGLSYAPLSPDNLKMYSKYLRGLNGWFEDVSLDFKDVNEFLNKFDKKISINVAYQIPHGAIRLEALGFNDVPLKGYALDKAKDLMRKGFEQGAVGFSTGLSYFPHSYSDTDELVELCKVCVEYDAPFVIHYRTVFRDTPFDPVEEAIEVARRSGVRLHFPHFRTDENTCGKAPELMAPIEKAMEEGIEITLELYPYYTGSGDVSCFLPPWVVEGGYEATLERLRNPLLRKRIIDGMKVNTFATAGTFTHLKKNETYVGMDFEDVAKERNQSVEDMICDLLIEENFEVGMRGNPTMNMEKREQMDKDFVWLLSRPYYMVGTDGIPLGFKPHPRAFGAFPRFLKLAKQHGMSYEDFANRTSFLPAKVFKLKNRGKIAEDYFADLVVFDPENIRDNATYKNPRRAPDGIEYVIVNGKIAVYKEKVTGMFSGQAIRREN
jgi:N-acyl-D-amino-acid deacylase